MTVEEAGGVPPYLTAAETLALITYGDLHALDGAPSVGGLAQCGDLRASYPAVRQQEADLRPAAARICAAALKGSLHPTGRRGNGSTGAVIGLMHEAIPVEFFMHRCRTVTLDGWAVFDAGAFPGEEWATGEYVLWRKAEAPDWAALRFPREEVMALWGPKPSLPPPSLQDLPAAWTLLECVVWIALRDTAAVRDAGEETPREPATFIAEMRLPDGSTVMAPQTGEAGYSGTLLTVEWAARKVEGICAIGPGPNDAEAELLRKLRDGTLTARGTPADGSGRRQMDADDWRGLKLYEYRRTLRPEPERCSGQVWDDVTLTRDDVVHVWPPFGDGPQGAARDVAGESLQAQPIFARTTQRKVPNNSLTAADAPLVQHMRTLVLSGQARNPWDAALTLSEKAAGAGNGVSKAKRLLKRYSEMSSAERL